MTRATAPVERKWRIIASTNIRALGTFSILRQTRKQIYKNIRLCSPRTWSHVIIYVIRTCTRIQTKGLKHVTFDLVVTGWGEHV